MKLQKIIPVFILFVTIMGLSSCECDPPDKATAVNLFKKYKYMGKWYEIARQDFEFEKDLNNTVAEYTLSPSDGTINVLHRGYNTQKKEWIVLSGKAKFVVDEHVGKLKVSFYRPFYSAYNVIAIDNDYKYALVTGCCLKYLWILSRERTIPNNIKEKYLKIAKDMGYNTANLVWVKHHLPDK